MPYSCSFCSEVFTTQQLRGKHQNKCARNPDNQSCDMCGEYFTKRGINKHKKHCRANSNRIACSYCSATCSNKEEHERNCRQNPANAAQTRCYFCRHYFDDLDEHLRQCFLNMCIYCNNHITSEPLEIHRLTCNRNPNNMCTYCRRGFNDHQNRNRHIELCTRNPNNICPHCRLGFNGRHELQTHTRSCQMNRSQRSTNVSRFESNSKSNEIEKQILNDRILALSSMLDQLTGDKDQILMDNDLSCVVCYEPSCNKTKCNHVVCLGCIDCIKEDSIDKRSTAECPVCRIRL